MPKLAAKDRKKVEKAEATGDFQAYPPGLYVGTLSKVEAKTSGNGNPYWNCEFDSITNLDGDKMPGRLWYILNLPTSEEPPATYTKGKDKWETYQRLCAGRIKGFFEAFGYEVESDTDEMIGDRIVLQVGIETAQNGPKAGQQVNRVNGVKALDSVDGAADIGSSGGKDEDDF